MEDKTLTHIGVLGMKWGRRRAGTPSSHGPVKRTISGKLMAKDGTIMTTRRGKLVPKVVMVKGKPREVNGRATSLHIQAKIKRSKAQIQATLKRVKDKKLADIDLKRVQQAQAAAGIALMSYGAIRMIQGPDY